jgi:hypothetical protein
MSKPTTPSQGQLVSKTSPEAPAADSDRSIAIDHILVEPIDGVPGRPWCVHSTKPHSAWIEFYRSRESALDEARAMLVSERSSR